MNVVSTTIVLQFVQLKFAYAEYPEPGEALERQIGSLGCIHFGENLVTYNDAKAYCEGHSSALAEPWDPYVARAIAEMIPFEAPPQKD